MTATAAGRTLPSDSLGRIVWAAMSFDRRLPGGSIPPEVWEALSPEWKDKINNEQGSSTRDHLGAEIRSSRTP